MASLPVFFSSLSSFPQISLSVLQHRLCKSPEPVCTVCRINLLIRLNNNLTESTVFWGVSKLNCLTERSDDTQRTSAKQGGETCQKKGRGRTVPFNSSEWLKCPRYIPVISEMSLLYLKVQLHFQIIHSTPAGFVFNMQIPARFEQGKVYWNLSTDPHLHSDIFSAQAFVLLWMTSYEYTGTVEEYSYPLCIHCFSGSISFIFLRKAYSSRKALYRNCWWNIFIFLMRLYIKCWRWTTKLPNL